MEDVLEVYHRPYDEKRPLVCLDESSKQLIGETIQPIPAAPGQPERFDHEYVRNGVMNLFMITMPLLGWRAVQVTDRRTMLDCAEEVWDLLQQGAVVLVCGNATTIAPAVRASLARVFRERTSAGEADAQAWLTGLRSSDRLLEDIWGG